MLPQVSVIVPVFQRLDCLRRALSSLEAQRFVYFEVIVADDGSDPSAGDVVAEFTGTLNIHFLRLAHSGRPSVPRNAALRACRADWVSFLDSDDTWAPEKLERVVEQFDRGVDVVHHKLRAVRADSSRALLPPFYLSRGRGFRGKSAVEHFAMIGNTVAFSSATVRRTLLLQAHGFDESLPCNDDYDLWLRLALQGARFRFLDESLGTYEMGECNISKSISKGLEARQRFREKYSTTLSPRLWRHMNYRLDYLDAIARLYHTEPSGPKRCPVLRQIDPYYWFVFQMRRLHALISRRTGSSCGAHTQSSSGQHAAA